MEQPEDQPKTTDGLPKTSPRRTDGLPKTSPIAGRGYLLSTLEPYAFIAVFVLMLLASFLIPQRLLDDWEMSILLFVVAPWLAWFVRIIYKSYR
jgi:hypothetical protein